MSDPLAEAIRNAWPSRSWEGPTLICGCGWETDMIGSGRHAQDCEDEFDAHMFEHLAKAARAFIGDEINAKYEAEKPTLNRWDLRDDGYEYGLDIAEQIARGDTK